MRFSRIARRFNLVLIIASFTRLFVLNSARAHIEKRFNKVFLLKIYRIVFKGNANFGLR